MTSAWAPAPVAVVWSVLFVGVVIVHVWHAGAMRGRHRLWHLGHVLAALGMLVMLWPLGPAMLLAARVGVWTYLAAAGLLAVSLLVARARGVALGPLWLFAVADLAWMACMFAMMSGRLVWLGVPGALWFAVQLVGWVGGRLGRVLEGGGLGDVGAAAPGSAPLVVSPADPAAGSGGHIVDGGAGAVRPDPAGATELSRHFGAGRHASVVDGGRRDWSVRASLAVMAAGMAYMLLAMQFGMTAMATGSAGMPGM